MSVILADHHMEPARGDGRGQVPAAGDARLAGERSGPVDHDIVVRRGFPGAVAAPRPAQFSAQITFLKEEVFEICGALALGESLLHRLGMSIEAARLAALFDVVEGRLLEPQPSEAGVSSLLS